MHLCSRPSGPAGPRGIVLGTFNIWGKLSPHIPTTGPCVLASCGVCAKGYVVIGSSAVHLLDGCCNQFRKQQSSDVLVDLVASFRLACAGSWDTLKRDKIILPFAQGCRVGVWFGFIRAALLPAVGTCVVLSFGVLLGWCCFLRVTHPFTPHPTPAPFLDHGMRMPPSNPQGPPASLPPSLLAPSRGHRPPIYRFSTSLATLDTLLST